jgi:hypothetical protein
MSKNMKVPKDISLSPTLPKYLKKNADELRRIRRGRLHVSSEDARKQFVMIQKAMAGIVDLGRSGKR